MSFKKLLNMVVLPAMLLIAQQSYAQDRTVAGKVTDSKDGSPVAGASVIPKGTSKGTSTAADGTYSITVGAGVTTLVITSVGYDAIEINVAGKTAGDASMKANAGAALNEVVVTGYGTAKRNDLTGSI